LSLLISYRSEGHKGIGFPVEQSAGGRMCLILL